jgi:hypothetical protein
MDVVQTLNSLLGPASKLFAWLKNRANPVRQQAARILQAFEAHGIQRTQINRLLPKHLQLLPFQLSDADELKKVLTQEHINWVAEFFALEREWLDGTSDAANQLIFSYKSPGKLHQWLTEHRLPAEQSLQFKLRLITSDTQPISPASQGYFAVVLEELMEVNEDYQSRYYHLTNGARFDHPPCLLHLMQILAIANHHNLMLYRSVLPAASLYQLSHLNGLIPDWLMKTKPHPLEADQEFWELCANNAHWLEQLCRSGLPEVAESIERDRKCFVRPKHVG